MLTFLFRLMRALSSRIADWRARRRTYAELNALDDISLADIGLTRADIPRLLCSSADHRKHSHFSA